MIERFVPAPRDADERDYIEAHLIICRECDFTTGNPTKDTDAVYEAHNSHFDETRHARFWKYSISRSTGRTGTIPELLKDLHPQKGGEK